MSIRQSLYVFLCAALVSPLVVPGLGGMARAAIVPTGFADEAFVAGLANPTAMQFAPDGRLFVTQQGGILRVVENGQLLATPFVTLKVDPSGERGLLGVAFDPDFDTNAYVYVYYTTKTPTIHNRISRFTAAGNVALAGSEQVILELNTLSTATNHNGGAIHFGKDGKLYVAVGDNADGANAQTLTNLLGKVLRINADGTLPTDNPFYGQASDVNRAIWTLGLRNPFTIAVRPTTGRLFINDVGQKTWEEINEGIAGANFGWPTYEGPSPDLGYANPLYYYGHTGGACAITGGAFYEPVIGAFPSDYVGDYFFADYCAGWIRRLDASGSTAVDFASGISSPVDLKVGPDGALYYLARGAGTVGRIRYTNSDAPTITRQPSNVTVTVGRAATFSVIASGLDPLAYQWRRNSVNIGGATAPDYTLGSAQLADSGASIDVIVSNPAGTVTSAPALLTVTPNTAPTAKITQPTLGTTYTGGSVISYAGTGSDTEDGVLPASAFTWWVDLHHDAHAHPHVLPVTGSKSGSFSIPTIGETSDNVFYRIHLQVKDSGGLTRSVTRDLLPQKSTVTLTTVPAGLELRLDGQPVATPYTFVGVVGIQRNLEAVSPQVLGSDTWQFSGWSDGGTRVHTISTPAAGATYVATFVAPRQMSIANASTIEGNDGIANAMFTVSLSGPSTIPVTVSWATANGSARAGTDYAAATGELTFPAGTTSRALTVPVLGDTALEPNENFYVKLSNVIGANLADAVAIGTIANDDSGGTISFKYSSYRKYEADTIVTVTVVRTGGVAGGARVRYGTTDGSALTGADYSASSGVLTFGLGVTSMTFEVPIKNDYLYEGDETVNLALSDPTGGATLGSRASSVLTIVDNDKPGTLVLSTSAYKVAEGGGSITVKVLRQSGSASGITVSYATGGGTATAGLDYVPAAGLLTFTGGQTSATFVVNITADALVEGDETFGLTLSAPTGGAILGTTKSATVVIVDDD